MTMQIISTPVPFKDLKAGDIFSADLSPERLAFEENSPEGKEFGLAAVSGLFLRGDGGKNAEKMQEDIFYRIEVKLDGSTTLQSDVEDVLGKPVEELPAHLSAPVQAAIDAAGASRMMRFREATIKDLQFGDLFVHGSVSDEERQFVESAEGVTMVLGDDRWRVRLAKRGKDLEEYADRVVTILEKVPAPVSFSTRQVQFKDLKVGDLYSESRDAHFIGEGNMPEGSVRMEIALCIGLNGLDAAEVENDWVTLIEVNR